MGRKLRTGEKKGSQWGAENRMPHQVVMETEGAWGSWEKLLREAGLGFGGGSGPRSGEGGRAIRGSEWRPSTARRGASPEARRAWTTDAGRGLKNVKVPGSQSRPPDN